MGISLPKHAKCEEDHPAGVFQGYKGRPPSIDIAKVRAMKAEGIGASEIAKALKIGRASVYRLMERLGA